MNKTISQAQKVEINLDATSVDIISKVDTIHRESLINLGISLLSKTGYYKTLIGKASEDLDEVVSLDLVDEDGTVTKAKKQEPEKKKATNSWDNF